ncbi:death-inducer obliterator 1-like isoform X2 [Anoplophora glabripennis]|uniref:death-inducer obliterator 1-like isoform X2 n=1 Tax=Anoplophora glabripennis TaxID=217634 RepID=UPI000873B783|nr:death-inducer obliterator 1-like isoform X2 [Anoplophora glabripennis]
MAHSVVKVTDIKDDDLNDSLLLLVGEDGTVTPDQDTVETFLKQRNGPTNIQIMKINKSEKQGIDITVDNVTYMPDAVKEGISVSEIIKPELEMDEVARNLYNFKLDHDYTPLTSPRRSSSPQEDDELVKTLSILDGPDPDHSIPTISSEPPPLILTTPHKAPSKVKIIQSITITPAGCQTSTTKTTVAFPQPAAHPPPLQSVSHKTIHNEAPTVVNASPSPIHVLPTSTVGDSQSVTTPVTTKSKAKIIKTDSKPIFRPERAKPTKPKTKIVKEVVEEESEEEFEEEDFDFEVDDDENDSDFDIEEELKAKQTLKRISKRTKSESKTSPRIFKIIPKSKNKEIKETKDVKQEPLKVETKVEKVVEKHIEKPPEKPAEKPPEQKPEHTEAKPPEKKPPKKEKKIPKPIPDDFALFSTPDIIRRVGGKEPTTPNTPEATIPTKPGKITSESRSKSSTENPQSPNKHNRNSVDGKSSEKEKHSNHHHTEGKTKERRISSGESKSKRTSIDEKSKLDYTKSDKLNQSKRTERQHSKTNEMENTEVGEVIPSAEDIRSIIMNEDTKSFTTSALPLDLNNSDPQNMDTGNLNLDTTGLDIDPSLLDNLNNDEISEDILYQVAQSLVSNPELQNAIDKGINDGVLDPMTVDQAVVSNQMAPIQEPNDVIQKGTQIVRPDGRIVVIPPIERPTTRSRNKKKEEVKQTFKPVHKPLDDDHVSGNELDSSNDEEEEDESEDDPNKLWCICNQPHNNRFMICCDTCEEWYHGKCVNITKAMGQQMEAEGKEWICLFCKDPMLKRPQAAARRIRKASRNSRASTDSAGSSSRKVESVTTVPCVVCQKLARKNSIYCSEACILAHAQGIERVVVFERATGSMLTGNKAPSAANLENWLKEHPGYEVVRSGGKVVTAKAGNFTQSRLKLVKNTDNEGVSLAVQKKGVSLGILKHSPKPPQQQLKPPLKATVTGIKIISKQINTKEPKTKLIQPQPISKPPVTAPPPKPKIVQTTLTLKTPQSTPPKPVKAPVSKEKMPVKTPKPKPPPEQPATPQPKPQENIRENVQKTVFEQLMNRLKSSEDLKLTEDEVKNISTEIESQLFKCFGDTGQKYRNKYRSLIFNIKDAKNQTLWRRICEKSINPYELVRLSPDDLASQELAMWREREAKHQLDMIKKSELELLNCNRQYVLKTHKGEQVVEDDRTDKTDNAEVIKSLTEGSTLDTGEAKRDNSKERDKKSSKHSHKDKDRDRDRDRKSSKDKEHRSHRSSSKDKERDRDRSRKRSRSRDRSSRHSDHKKRSRSRDRDRDRHRKSSHKSSRHKKDIMSTTEKLDKKSKEILEQLVDNKIVPPLEDRLWKHVPQEDIVPAPESDSDHEPSSTVTIPTPPRSQESDEFSSSQMSNETKNSLVVPENDKEVSQVEERSTSPPPRNAPTEIWRGTINMIDVAQISITAHEVSGDCSGLGKELPENLDIVGRISPDTVWDYIGKMKCSNSKIISLLRLNATNIEEKMPYLALYSYLSSRTRLGVVKSTNKAVKDFYILPLAPQKPIPQALLPLNGPGFEESRPALLLGIIVRDKRKRPHIEPIVPTSALPKRSRVETPPLPVIPPPPVVPPRSYTPPPLKDARLKLPLPPPLPPTADEDENEPYSPEDSDPDAPAPVLMPVPPPLTPAPMAIPDPVTPSVIYPAIPGLSSSPLPSTTLEIQRQMEELNKKIEMQKSEITSMTQNIVSASSEIGTSALANIALPSNLQQILDSIKTIGETSETPTPPPQDAGQNDLTIPLMIPKTFTRPLSNPSQRIDMPSDTIPLNLPSKPKIKPLSVNSPILEEKSSVLGSLSEEDLIRKAAEMLGEEDFKSKRKSGKEPLPPTPPKRAKNEVVLPPVPGLEDEIL